MKALLTDLLNRVNPSRTTVNNCIELIQREHATAPDAATSHEERLRRARNAALDTAQYLEAALQEPRTAAFDHADLLGRIQNEIRAREARYRDATVLRNILFEHETARTLRALRKA